MEQACPLVILLLQCRSNLCLHPVNALSLWCLYTKSNQRRNVRRVIVSVLLCRETGFYVRHLTFEYYQFIAAISILNTRLVPERIFHCVTLQIISSKIQFSYDLLWYHPYFRYTMNSSNKDITFDWNPLNGVNSKATLVKFFYCYIQSLFSSLSVLFILCPLPRT